MHTANKASEYWISRGKWNAIGLSSALVFNNMEWPRAITEWNLFSRGQKQISGEYMLRFTNTPQRAFHLQVLYSMLKLARHGHDQGRFVCH